VTGFDVIGPRIADRLLSRQDAILEFYVSVLASSGSVLVADWDAREQTREQARHTLGDICAELRTGDVVVDARAFEPSASELALSRKIGEDRAAAGIHPVESLRAAGVLYEVMMESVADAVRGEPLGAEVRAVAARAAHHSLLTRIRVASYSYSGFLLDEVHKAQIGERARIARELHDRLGSGISAATRLIELARAYQNDDPDRARERIAQAEEALRAAAEDVRTITYDLRLHAGAQGFEVALKRAVEAIRPDDVEVLLEVVGDESWATPVVLDELFLVVREAIRNAFVHASAHLVAAHVEFAPHEVRGAVRDDGAGFDPAKPGRSDGIGLHSMRERMELMGGRITIFSAPGQGTSVEALVPLRGAFRAG
jgi:signal transduction histidine kinase